MTVYKKIILILLAIVMIWSVINPAYLQDWFWEALPVFLFLPVLFLLDKHFKFSNVSFILIVLFLILSIFDAHYEVAKVPLGYLLGQWLGLVRNMYDRFVHFFFGFLCAYPLFEIYVRKTGKKDFWSYTMPFTFILALSAAYEILEWGIGIHINSFVGTSFLGAQGDVFDSPKDMAMAALGAILALSSIFFVNLIQKKFNRKLT